MNPISVYVLAPVGLTAGACAIILAVGVRDRRPYLKQSLVALGGALLGLLPFWLYRLAYGDAALDAVTGSLPPQNSWPDHAANAWQYFWHDGLPTLIGIRGPRDKSFWLNGMFVVIPVYFAALGVLLAQVAGAGRRPSPLRFANDSTPAPRNAAMVAFMLLLAFPIFFYGALSARNFAVLIPDSGLLTRYLLPLYIPFAVALGLLFSHLSRLPRLGALAILVGVNLVSLLSTDAVALARNEFSNQPLPPNSADVESFLLANDLNAVLTNHWIGYVLTFDTRERILTYDYTDSEHGSDRFPEYSRQVRAALNPALVVFNPHYEANYIDARLIELGITYQKADLPNFIVYYEFSRPVIPKEIEAVLQWPYY
jgi:hypothetical protein